MAAENASRVEAFSGLLTRDDLVADVMLLQAPSGGGVWGGEGGADLTLA